ncbi:MAG TPA: hypothetical protein VM598_13520 [Bdellovibrionota bacterium]|nr:hypothetical protein [Bdellovibrionota bacterium]
MAGLALLVVGMLLRGIPSNPDVEFSHAQVLGLYFIFGGFFLAVVGWGCLLAERLGFAPALWKSLALGTAGSSLLAMVLGYAGLISYDFAPLAVAWLGGGLVFGSSRWRKLLPERIRPSLAWIPALVCAYYITDWMARTGLAHGSTDPFFYHLLGPRLWADFGRIDYQVGFPATFHASWWEQLFIWMNMLLGDHEGRGLLEGHLFAQMIHVGLGVTMTCAAVFAFTRAYLSWSGWAWLAVYAILNSQALQSYAWLAKNDFGVMGWAMAGLLLLLLPEGRDKTTRRNELLVGGALVGMAIIGKIVFVISLGPLLVVWAFLERRSKGWQRAVLTAGAAALVPMAVMMARNFAFTGDPLFPFLTVKLGLPTRWLGPTHLETIPSLMGKQADSLAWSADVVWRFIMHVPWIGLLSLLVFPLARFVPKFRPLAMLTGACIAAFAIFSSIKFGEAFFRWLGPALLIQGAAAVIVIGEGSTRLGDFLARKSRSGHWVRPALTGLVVAATLAAARIDVTDLNVWNTLLWGSSQTYTIRNPHVHQGGDSLTWLRLNMSPGDRTVTTGFQLTYYVSHLKVLAIANEPLLDEAVSGLTDPHLLVSRLRELGVRYVLDVAKWNARYYWKLGWVIDQLASEYPEAIAYEGPDSFVLDLAKVAPPLERSCAAWRAQRELDW